MIWVVHPGSGSRILIFNPSRIPDLGVRIRNTDQDAKVFGPPGSRSVIICTDPDPPPDPNTSFNKQNFEKVGVNNLCVRKGTFRLFFEYKIGKG
jgi:hypothetical protein